jgi:CheY-like chemotaxis protein
VCTFTDPFKALSHFNLDSTEDYHDKVLSDIRMPVMNGYEFVKKAKEIDKQVNVVLMSAFEIKDAKDDDDNNENNKEFLATPQDVKIDAFIQKPFSIKTLRNILQKRGYNVLAKR